MTEKELKLRTRKFAVEILNFVDKLPNRRSANIIANQLGDQLLRSLQIMGQLVAQGHMQSLLQKSELLKRKLMSRHFGSISLSIPRIQRPR